MRPALVSGQPSPRDVADLDVPFILVPAAENVKVHQRGKISDKEGSLRDASAAIKTPTMCRHGPMVMQCLSLVHSGL